MTCGVNARGEAEIDIVKCKGCGTCAGGVSGAAIDLMHYRGSQLRRRSGAGGGISTSGNGTGILTVAHLFSCGHCGERRNPAISWMPDQVRHDNTILRPGITGVRRALRRRR